MAAFTVAFNTPYTGEYRVVGSKGILEMNPGYSYKARMIQRVITGSRVRQRIFPQSDQFGCELDGFAQLVRSGKGRTARANEGVADVRIIAAIQESLRQGIPVKVSKSR